MVNKPQGPTSHDVVLLVRRKLGIRQVGHAGTLDPMARGVLVLLVGQATKFQHLAQTHRKRYDAAIQLGIQTNTGDAWGKVIRTADVPSLTPREIQRVLASLVGRLTQVPPPFSAAKVHGRPLYWWSRRGKSLTAKPRTVELFALELLDAEPTRFRCRIECSSGTYIRNLAETMAERLGTVGHVSDLVRLAVGPWDLAQARDVPWMRAASPVDLRAAMQPPEGIHACADRP